MGLFNTLLGPKTCAICGNNLMDVDKIVGSMITTIKVVADIQKDSINSNNRNTGLADGSVLCKNCASKVSPFFNLSASTLARVEQHLKDREENQKLLNYFNPTINYELGKRICIDTSMGKMVVLKGKKTFLENPDLVDLADIITCKMEVFQKKEEITYEGFNEEKKSYNPRQFNYEYTFIIHIMLTHPYISRIDVPLNRVFIENPYVHGQRPGLFSQRFPPFIPDERSDFRYRESYEKGQHICDELIGLSSKHVYKKSPPPHPRKSKFEDSGYIKCPWCGSNVKQIRFEN